MIAPDMIDPVVHENRRKAPQNTALMWSVRFGAMLADHGYVVAQNCRPPWRLSGPCGMSPVSMQP